MDEEAKILQVLNISKSFADLEVLKDISFHVDKGEVVSIIGPSGSGKSTLLRIINQLETSDNGSAYVGGLPLFEANDKREAIYSEKKIRDQIRTLVGLVFQQFHLFPHYSILQNITAAPVMVFGKDVKTAQKEAGEILEKLGLSDKEAAFPYQLSGGQQQRAAIARALALHPEILFFDEPTSALDPELTGEVIRVIHQLAKEHMTMVIVTHEMAFAREISDRIVFMDAGVIVEQGSPEDVFSSENLRTKQFLARYGT